MAGIAFQKGWSPGILGRIVTAHGDYYAASWGFGAVFELKVARELSAFVSRYDPDRDALFHAAGATGFCGALAIDGSDPELDPGLAHLRWFIVTEGARGSGTGRKLMDEGLAFLRKAGFARCYLTTFAGLDAARRL